MMNVKGFESFKAELRDTPEDIVADELDLLLECAASDILESLSPDIDPVFKTEAILEYGLLAMAKASSDTQHDNPLTASYHWIDVAREEIKRYVIVSPEERSPLLGTVFFTQDPAIRRGLNRIVSACVEPAGWYDARSFKAGVAFGRISKKN
jgi:hypothetical protein